MNLEAGETTRLTDDKAVDYLPVWHPDGKSISYTSHAGSTPNIHTISLDDKKSTQLTDCGDGIWSVQWNPKSNHLLARTLNDVDSVRIVQVDPKRTITTASLNLREDFTSWRVRSPELIIPKYDMGTDLDAGVEKYNFYKYPKHFTSFILPLDGPLAMTLWTDALGKHLFTGIGGYSKWDFQTPYHYISYTNAQHGPLWGVNMYKNVAWSFREYDESYSGLLEKFDGGAVWLSLPFNSGNDMAANHSLTFQLSLHQRSIPTMPYDSIIDDQDTTFHSFTEDLFEPEEGREGIVTLEYTFTRKRPHKSNNSLPRNGWGFRSSLDAANKEIYGDFSYNRLTLDTYSNCSLKPAILFLRGKVLKLWGDPPAQEYVGFSRDEAIYLPGSGGTGGMYENMNIRGSNEIRMGDLLAYATAEFRIPIMPSIPAHLLGITIGDISGAVFTDFGQVWDENESTGGIIATAGYELKYGWKIGDFTLFFFSLGAAQSIEDWQDNMQPAIYTRYALVNPF